MINLMLGDCLERMKEIPDKSVDMVLCDPPYGTTACKWDSVIPFEPMWAELKRITKDNSAVCLFGSEPFSSNLRMSNLKMYRYDWIWEKAAPSNFALAKLHPLKYHEIVSVFYQKTGRYFPIKEDRSEGGKKRLKNPYKRNPSDVAFMGKFTSDNSKNEYDNFIFPRSIQYFNNRDADRGFHPTQKPVPLLEYLVKTYTLEGETVLDFTMGSGSTGVAAKNLGRKFIGIERDEKYFEIAQKRIEGAELSKAS